MAAQSKNFYSGAGDEEAAERNYLSRKKSKRPNSNSPDHFKSTTGVTVCKLSPSQTDRITQPYSQNCLIGRIVGKFISSWQLAACLRRHLRLTEVVKVFELGFGYFVLKFSETDYLALEDHPWPIPNLCISVFPWTPNFKPSEAPIAFVDAWIRLHELPIEYYDEEILRQIAGTIGDVLVKIDPVTKDRKKCKYARICVRINLCYPLPSAIMIGRVRQEIEYEGFDLLCPRCRCVVDLKHDCLHIPSGSSRFVSPQYHRSHSFQATGSRYQVLQEEEESKVAPLLDLNEWPSLSATRTSTSSLQPQLPGLVPESIQNQKEICGFSVQTLPNLSKSRLEKVPQSYPIPNPDTASIASEVPVELEHENLIPSIDFHDHPLSISSYPEADSTAITTTFELEQNNSIPSSIALNDHPLSISSYPEAASTVSTTLQLEQDTLIPSIAFHDHPLSISSYPEADSTPITTTFELEQNNSIPSIALNDHPMSISSYPEAAGSTATTAPELEEQNILIPSISLDDHPMSISSCPQAPASTIIVAPAELEQNHLNLSMALAPCAVKDQFIATETSRSDTIAAQPSSSTATIRSLLPNPTSNTARRFCSNGFECSLIKKVITNTSSKGIGINRRPILYTFDSSTTSFAMGLSRNPDTVPEQNQIVMNIVSTTRSGKEHGIGSHSKKMLCWNFRGIDNANLIEGLKYMVQKYEISIVVIFGTRISDDVVQEVVDELGFCGSYCKRSDEHNGGVWLLIFRQDVQTEVYEVPQQGSAAAAAYFHLETNEPFFSFSYGETETSYQTWVPAASLCASTHPMANALAY